MTTGYLDVCKFLATSTGTADFVPASAVTGYQTPASAGAVDATRYYYRAESSDLTQWEVGYGNYTVSGTTLARTTILFSSNSGSKTSFSAAPQVAIVAVAETMVPQAIGQLPGSATNDSASAGNVGELKSAAVTIGSPTSLSNNTIANLASITLTAGDWDIWGAVQFTGGSTTTVNYLLGSISTANNTCDSGLDIGCYSVAFYGSAVTIFVTIPGSEGPSAVMVGTRISISSNTTYYLNAQAGFGVSTCSGAGKIQARRVR